MLKITGLSKNYGAVEVLKEINLNFNKGDVHGITGANGAGKTTLFKCICGLESGIGQIEYDGGILKNVTGFLPTEPYFFSNMTGYEYLQLLCNARNIKVNDLHSFNLFSLPLSRYAETYSTGMQKQLAITGMLLQRNELFILDEPFNGVDMSSSAIIKEMISKMKNANKIVIVSSHILSYMQELCDYLHYLKDGRIVKTYSKGEKIDIEMDSNENARTILDSLI